MTLREINHRLFKYIQYQDIKSRLDGFILFLMSGFLTREQILGLRAGKASWLWFLAPVNSNETQLITPYNLRVNI